MGMPNLYCNYSYSSRTRGGDRGAGRGLAPPNNEKNGFLALPLSRTSLSTRKLPDPLGVGL